MHVSTSITGLLGLASLTSGLLIVNTTNGHVISNTTTKHVNDTSRNRGWPKFLPPGFHGGHGPVVIPGDKWKGIHSNDSHSRVEANATSRVTINNTTKHANDTTGSKINWPKLPPSIQGGPGPVAIPADKWKEIHANSSHSWAEANATTRLTISNTTKDVNDTTPPKVNWPEFHTGIEGGGPGPVVIPEDTWEDIPIETSSLWLEMDATEEEGEALRRGRRVSTEERRAALISKRDGPGDPLPPRDRTTLADHMENHGSQLPECYKKCMRSEDGKSSIHMGKDTLGKICGIKWPLFAWWSEHHIYFCVNGPGGCPAKEDHRVAYRWLKWTCGDKPN